MNPKLIIIDCRSLQAPAINGVIKVGRNFLKDLRKLSNNQKRMIIWTNGIKKIDENFIVEKKYFKHIHTRIPNILLHLTFKFLPIIKIDHLLIRKIKKQNKEFIKNTQKFYFGFDLRSIQLSKKIAKKTQYIHDIAFDKLKENLSRKAKFFYYLMNPTKTIKNLDLIITNSKFSKSEIFRRFKHNKIRIIEPGLKKIGPKFKEKIINKKDYILCISSSDPRKNLDQLVKISKKKPDQEFILVSNDFDYHKKIQTKSNFKIFKNLDETEIQKLIHEAKATIYLSNYEGFGMPIYESIQNRTPVIVNKNKHYIQTFKKENLSFIENENIPKDLKSIQKTNLYISKHQSRKLLKAIIKL